MCPHDRETLKSLEHHVWYLAELLDPLAAMHRDQISPVLQYEVLMLGRRVLPRNDSLPYQRPTSLIIEHIWRAADCLNTAEAESWVYRNL
ncbi:hypothetical protein BS47DRAFT_1347615 [Hydnum rufescens UP504]|uniref:Uncharacterized protein n=1 Tax=Hydnum rufescens UP504 TaxID=1448309 RepID=A0A9P6ARL3_9AGAM|nr:hypothetical protein BS47DRAFT_1347615 [Hydnum rufescens UP504]